MSGEAWYHADFCHAYAWVYEEGDHLRVRWGERDRENLYLHARDDCARCAELAHTRERGRYGEFTMPKPLRSFDELAPDAKLNSATAFFHVQAELAKRVPGLTDDDGAGEGSRPSLPVAPDGPDSRAAGAPPPNEPRAEREARLFGERITHGRHCTCTPCARQDWTLPELAPCGMHGPDCPRSYQPWGGAGTFTRAAGAPTE